MPTPLVIPDSGSSEFVVAKGSARAGTGSSVTTYRVEVEKDLPFDADDFADAVDTTLADERGWIKNGRRSFQRTPDGSLRILLATPGTTDRLCAPLRTFGQVSCRNGNKVIINAIRWARGSEAFGPDLPNYRNYLINHEVGHSLGFGHAACPGPGQKAPVMLQQTKSLDGCKANPWP